MITDTVASLGAGMASGQRIDILTIAGIALLLMPLLTAAHEVSGHATACFATGGKLAQIGAFYVDCQSPTDAARRIVALAGMAVDALLGAIAWLVWHRLRGDLARLIGWYCWLCLSFSAAGYFLFSGVSGIGDLGPDAGGGIGPLPHPVLIRAAFALGGGVVYFCLVRAGIRGLNVMIGTGAGTLPSRRRIAHGFYAVICGAAVLASLLNPVGVFITLASAGAASIGGKAGLISIGYANRGADAPLPFVIARNWPLIVAGVIATLAFAAILGPTLALA